MLRTILLIITLPLTFLFAEINENYTLTYNRDDAITFEFNFTCSKSSSAFLFL